MYQNALRYSTVLSIRTMNSRILYGCTSTGIGIPTVPRYQNGTRGVLFRVQVHVQVCAY